MMPGIRSVSSSAKHRSETCLQSGEEQSVLAQGSYRDDLRPGIKRQVIAP